MNMNFVGSFFVSLLALTFIRPILIVLAFGGAVWFFMEGGWYVGHGLSEVAGHRAEVRRVLGEFDGQGWNARIENRSKSVIRNVHMSCATGDGYPLTNDILPGETWEGYIRWGKDHTPDWRCALEWRRDRALGANLRAEQAAMVGFMIEAPQDPRIRLTPRSEVTSLPPGQPYRPPVARSRPASGRDFHMEDDWSLGLRTVDSWVELLDEDVVRMGINVENRAETRYGQVSVHCLLETSFGPRVVEWMAFEPDHVMPTGETDASAEDVTLEGAIGTGRCVVRHRNDRAR